MLGQRFWRYGLLMLALNLALALAKAQAAPSLQVLFTPWDNAEQALVKEIGQAKKQILVQAFVFTSRTLAQALIQAQRRGVEVQILADRERLFGGNNEDEARSASQIPNLRNAGIGVWLEVKYAAAHNKIMVIDAHSAKPVVVTGSYNWSYSAQHRNAENLLIFRDNPALTQQYFNNWQRHRADALPYNAQQTQ
jgi:phosphatidylserine/phosphatidylglycerophosphate/cardiolipin synthase-like enzyme